MPYAIRVYETGGADKLRYEEVPMPQPGTGEVLIEHKAIGLNFIDVYYRTGYYKNALPFTPGLEGAGVVVACGRDAKGFKPGDRVAYSGGPLGAYATHRTIPEHFLARLPGDVSFEIAAGLMVKGLTAHYLLRRTFVITKEHTILVHAAAGGVGLLLCQWAKHLGARVIGTVSSEEKATLAKENGCDYPIIYTKENVVQRVRELTDGKGVNVVYDSVGHDTFLDSLDCLCVFGLMVSYGQASGPIPPFDVSLLMQKGSLFLTRPSLMHYIQNPMEYILACAEMFELAAKGVLKVHIKQSYHLKDAGRAHQDLESRKTQGSTILVP